MFIVKQNFAPFTENHGNVRLTSSFERPSPTAGYGENDAANRPNATPKARTAGGLMRPAAAGRRAVRRICASNFRSRYWFSVPVPLATSKVPSKVLNSPATENLLSLADAR